MEISNEKIDSGKAFDWGKTSADYARYRDIYPQIFYEKIIERNLCLSGQKVLDIGTGTGVLPRNMYRYGAKWTGTDISDMQVTEAERMSAELNQDIQYYAAATEELEFPDNSFDVITACQCFWYFDHKKVMPKLARILKLVLKYSPKWSGAGERKHPIAVPDIVYETFEAVYHEEYDIEVPFTRESWNGRMKACRGVGASLSPEEIIEWETEHRTLLEKIAPETFCVKHYAAMLELKLKKRTEYFCCYTWHGSRLRMR